MQIEFEQHVSERLYPVGYEFTLKRGKADPKQATVIDYAITHNAQGKIVKFEYVIEYSYIFGQVVRDSVPQTTIDIATNNGWKNL